MHFSFQAGKIKKIRPEKNSLYFGKWNFLDLIFKNFLNFLIFREMELFSPSSKNEKIYPYKNFLYFRKRSPGKTSYIFKRKLFLYFGKRKPRKKSLCFRKRKRNFLIFQEVTFRVRKVKRTYSQKAAYILGNEIF